MDPMRNVKHLIKLFLGKPDSWWYFDRLERHLTAETVEQYGRIMKWADDALAHRDIWENPELYKNSQDDLVRQGWHLKQNAEVRFKNSLRQLPNLRILIHVPDEKLSPAGFSLFFNMIESFRYLGIASDMIRPGESTEDKLATFKPSIFMTSDHASYLNTIDWDAISRYKSSNRLLIGLTAGLEEYGNTPLKLRLDWAKTHGVSFYYSYRDIEYLESRPAYKPFYDHGYKIFSVPFGANPLIHYPIPLGDQKRDIDYAFLASSQVRTKGKKYYDYIDSISSKHFGFIAGHGWPHAPNFRFSRERDRYIYSRSKVALNIHQDEQIKWSCEVNERTYQLAACGIPQITDHALLLDKLFSPEALFVADNPREYREYFEYIIAHPPEGTRRALIAQKEVFEKYTTFQRASEFATMLASHFKLTA